MNLQLPLKRKWFEMTKAGVKPEDYREITPYWCNRLLYFNGENKPVGWWEKWFALTDNRGCDGRVIGILRNKVGKIKAFNTNTMTLGYPKACNCDRILKFKHEGIEIRRGNTDWGAEPGKRYFVIKHGASL